MASKTSRKRGTVQAFNVSPKGLYEGLLLESSAKLIQVNFPPDLSAVIEQAAPIGQAVEVEVEASETKGKPAHPVYRLLALRNENGQRFEADASLNGNSGFSGKVVRLNYALHGEVNGGILDNGDFLHLKPNGAAAVELSVGMKVRGSGQSKPKMGGGRVIDADEVNGTPIEHKPKPKKKPAHH